MSELPLFVPLNKIEPCRQEINYAKCDIMKEIQAIDGKLYSCSEILDWLFDANNHRVKEGISYRHDSKGIALIIFAHSGKIEIIMAEVEELMR